MNDPVDMLLNHLDKVRETKPGQYEAVCPAHEDRNPSLAISRGDDGRVLLKCWAGCGAAEIVQALGLTLADLFQRDEYQSPSRKRQYPDYRKILRMVSHEVEVVFIASQDLAEGRPLSDDDMQSLWRARGNLEKTLRAANVSTTR